MEQAKRFTRTNVLLGPGVSNGANWEAFLQCVDSEGGSQRAIFVHMCPSGWRSARDVYPAPWLFTIPGGREWGSCEPEKWTESSRTVLWSHSVTSLEKEAGEARRDCTRAKSGKCSIRRPSVSEA